MSIRIFLGGGGDENQAEEIDNLYGKTIGNGAKVLYIPIAWSNSEQFSSCLNWFKNAYARFNFEIEMLTDFNDVDYEFLDKVDSIYIGGGNTFALLKTIKETNFNDLLNKFIVSGKVVYGGSAGAIILGKDVGTAFIGNCADENIVQATDFLGLDVASGYSIKCHYEEEEEEEVKEFSMTNNTSVLAISETGGVYIEGDKITLIGDVEVIKKD